MNMEDEVICDHLVTAKQKHINAVFLDLVQEFGRLCKENDITWWIIFGGLIGVARHQGFIPWDDDIDVAVPRKDFDRLLAMTNEQFGAKAPYFLQNPVNDPENVESLLRFRRSDTTCIRPVDYEVIAQADAGYPYNMGLCLAIFPVDNYPRTALMQNLQFKLSGILTSMMYRAYEPSGDKSFRYLICHTARKWMGNRRFISARHWPLRWGQRHPSGKVQIFAHYYKNSTVYEAEDFQNTVWLPFEDIQVPCPAGYDRILTTTYRNYMSFPPLDKRGGHDAYESYDTPYTVSIDKMRAGEIPPPQKH